MRLFSTHLKEAQVTLKVVESNLDCLTVQGFLDGVFGKTSVSIFGSHNVYNLMGAVSIALSLGMKAQDVWQTLSLCRLSWGRGQRFNLKNGAQVIFDAYNANPESMKVLLDNVSNLKGNKVFILGEMLEMGNFASQAHEILGYHAGCVKELNLVWFVGSSCEAFLQGLKKSHFKKNYFLSSEYKHDIAQKVASMIKPSDIVAIKGSRGVRLEKIFECWGVKNFESL